MTEIKNNSSDDLAHRHPEMEHFSNLNTILHSLVDFIRPETFIARDELETYNELKEKFLRESTTKRSKRQQQQPSKSPLETAGVQSIRTTSGIYRFLAHHHKPTPSAANNKQQSTTPVSRQELLRKLHEKMPHRQQQEENGVEPDAKRKRTKEKSKEREKKPRPTPVEWSAPSTKPSTPKPTSKSSTVPNQITFGRFDFKTEDTIDISSKKKKGKKPATKQKQLVNTLKKIEDEQNELNRLHDENPDEEKALLRSKHWKSAMAKAKGEKIRDNPQLLRKSIKKQQQLRARSAKKWKKNKSETDKRMKERQEKRTANLQKRKDEKKAKLKKRLIKKGRLIS